MKVELTERRHVDAHGRWFTAKVAEQAVTITTDFGTVRVSRVRLGLQVELKTTNRNNEFIELKQGEATTRILDPVEVTATIRPFGSVTLAEMDDPELRDLVQKWMGRQK